MLPLSIRFPPPAHTLPGTWPFFRIYMQPLSIRYTPAPHVISASYVKPANHTHLSNIGLIYIVQNFLYTISPLAIIITTSTGYNKKLLNLAKIYTDDAKYSDYNNSFIFKLAMFHDICFKADILLEVKMNIFPIILKGLALNIYFLNIGISNIIINFE